MKLGIISMIMMILLAFTAMAENVTTTFDTKTGQCPTTGNCVIPGDYKGSSIYPSQNLPVILPSGVKIITPDTIKFEQDGTMDLTDANVNGVTFQSGTGVQVDSNGKFSIKDGVVEGTHVTNVESVTYGGLSRTLSGTVSGTGSGNVADVLLTGGTKFDYTTESNRLTITDGRAAFPSNMNLQLTVLTGSNAQVELFVLPDGSSVDMGEKGEVMSKDGKLYVHTNCPLVGQTPLTCGGAINYVDYTPITFLVHASLALRSLLPSEEFSICPEKTQCDTSGAYVIMTRDKFEAHNIGGVEEFTGDTDYIKGVIGNIQLGPAKYAELTSATTGKPATVAINGVMENGGTTTAVVNDEVYTRNTNPSDTEGTVPIDLQPVSDDGTKPLDLNGGTITIDTDTAGIEEVNYCPAGGGATTGAATRWITGMAEQLQCTVTGTCSKFSDMSVALGEIFNTQNYQVKETIDGEIMCKNLKTGTDQACAGLLPKLPSGEYTLSTDGSDLNFVDPKNPEGEPVKTIHGFHQDQTTQIITLSLPSPEVIVDKSPSEGTVLGSAGQEKRTPSIITVLKRQAETGTINEAEATQMPK